MQVPTTCSLSGTKPSELLEDYFKVLHSLREALNSLHGVYPHGRDYQHGDINAAMREHADRCMKIRQVIAEVETLAEAVV